MAQYVLELRSGTTDAILYNNSGTGFGMLQFGGASAGFPGIKRSAALLQFRLADDTGYCSVEAANVQAGGNSFFQFAGRSKLASAADGSLSLRDSAGTSFSTLQFGGTSASEPALKRVGTHLQLRLADDSGYGTLQLGGTSAALRVGTHNAIGAETVTGYITIKDVGGTDRKIAVVS